MNFKDKLQQLEPETKKNNVNGLKLSCKKRTAMSVPENCSCGNCHKKNGRNSKTLSQVFLFQRTEIESSQLFPSAESEFQHVITLNI